MSDKAIQNYKKEAESISVVDSEDENLLLSNALMNKNKRALVKYEIVNMKALPNVFSALFLIILCLISVKYVPNFYFIAKTNHFYHIKGSVNSFSDYFSDQNIYFRVLIIGVQFFFSTIILGLASLIKQRISVPELSSQKSKNYFLIFLSIISMGLLIGLNCFKNNTLIFTTIHLGLSDNILYVGYLLSYFLICLLTYSILTNIDTQYVPLDQKVLGYKKNLLYILFVNLMLYYSCLVLVSYYKPIIAIEKLFVSFAFLLKEVNSIMFLLDFMLFILTIKYDLMYLHTNLNMRPDIEYFMESEKLNLKSTL